MNLLRIVITFLEGIILSYLVIVVVMFSYQRGMIYVPLREMKAPAKYGLPDFAEYFIHSADKTKIQLWFKKPDDGGDVVVYFPGNGGNIASRVERFRQFSDAGYGVLALSYRGYGRSEGKPTEAGLYQDARAAIAYLKDQGIDEKKMIFFGESLGTGVAVQMALENEPDIVVLEAPFTSLADVAYARYPYMPVKYLLMDKYDSYSKIGKVTSPVLILHGLDDVVVPERFSNILLEEANEPKKRLQYAKIGHLGLQPEHIMKSLSEFRTSLLDYKFNKSRKAE